MERELDHKNQELQAKVFIVFSHYSVHITYKRIYSLISAYCLVGLNARCYVHLAYKRIIEL